MFKKRNPTNQQSNLNSIKEDLNQIKTNLEIEKAVVKKIKQDLETFDENEPELLEQYRTTLTDEEIAKTTQVEVDTDDIAEFVQNNLKPKTKK